MEFVCCCTIFEFMNYDKIHRFNSDCMSGTVTLVKYVKSSSCNFKNSNYDHLLILFFSFGSMIICTSFFHPHQPFLPWKLSQLSTRERCFLLRSDGGPLCHKASILVWVHFILVLLLFLFFTDTVVYLCV